MLIDCNSVGGAGSAGAMVAVLTISWLVWSLSLVFDDNQDKLLELP